MVQINRLSARGVDSLKADGVYADGAGLYVRVRGGAKHFIFIYRHAGKRREMGLGTPRAVGLAKARERAQAARELVADGKDPAVERRMVRELPMFGVLADGWVADRKASVRNSKSVDRWERVFRAEGEGVPAGYAAALRPLRVDQITTDDILGVLKPIWSMGATATLARGYIEAVLDAAKAKGLRKGDNPARWKGHLDHILPKPSKLARGHHASLPFDAVPAFMAQMRAREGVVARSLEFTVLTAARTGEVLGARWEEIDLEAALWVIPAARMKAGREHRVPLSPRAVAILRALKPAKCEAAGLVFMNGAKPVSNMAGPMLLRRMKIPGTIHGFRSSFRDWAGDRTDFPREVAEAALAHTLQGVEAAYRRSDALEKRRCLMDAWAAFCGAPSKRPKPAAEPESPPPGNVTKLRTVG